MTSIFNIFKKCKCEKDYIHCKKLKHKCICSPNNQNKCKSEEHECICFDCIKEGKSTTICKGGQCGQHVCMCMGNPKWCRKVFVDLPFYPSSTMYVYGVHHKCICKVFIDGDKICKRHNGIAKNKNNIMGIMC